MNDTSRVVELGCGTGSMGIEFAHVCRDYYGVDISRPMLEIFRNKADRGGIHKC